MLQAKITHSPISFCDHQLTHSPRHFATNRYSRGRRSSHPIAFSAHTRADLTARVQALQRTIDRNHNSPKAAWTICSRRIHYFIFCQTLNLTDDWTLANQLQESANYQLALYATHLATGSFLHCRSLKASTIARYLLLEVAKFLGRYRDVNPRFRSTADTRLAQ